MSGRYNELQKSISEGEIMVISVGIIIYSSIIVPLLIKSCRGKKMTKVQMTVVVVDLLLMIDIINNLYK